MTLALENLVLSTTMTQGKTLEPDTSGAREFLQYEPSSNTNLPLSEERKIELITRQITSLLELPEKWDGEKAQHVSEIAAQRAASITYLVSGDYADLAQFFPTPIGGIQVEWFVNGNELEIEIDNKGNAFVASVDEKGTTLFEQEFSLNDVTILKKIKQEIERLSLKLRK